MIKGDLRSRRLELGLNFREVAQKAAISETLLRKLERGLILPDDDSLLKLAKIFNVGKEDLRASQCKFVESVVPGEGYTTATPSNSFVTARKKEPSKNKRRLLDLFCGAGGLSYGFEQSKHFQTVCGIDLLPDRVATFCANHPVATGIVRDLREVSSEIVLEWAGEIDIVVGGPPCQGFSSIRPFRTLTEGDGRNTLVEHFVLLISEIRPQWFVFENVVGLLKHQSGKKLDALLQGFSDAGYKVDWKVVNAALFGVPQNRERILIVGNRDGLKFTWPSPTHNAEYKSMAGTRREVMVAPAPIFRANLLEPITVMESIGDLPPVASGEEATEYIDKPSNEYQESLRLGADVLTLHKATRHSEKMLNVIRHAGYNKSDLPPGLVTSGFSSCYSRLHADRPSTTITVNFVHPASNRCIHPDQDRALTPREGARIQGFPDSYTFVGNTAQIVKQIGNAVPPKLGNMVANAIVNSEKNIPN